MTPHPLHRLCKALLAGGPQHMQRANQRKHRACQGKGYCMHSASIGTVVSEVQ